jgi:hypothetical protein
MRKIVYLTIVVILPIFFAFEQEEDEKYKKVKELGLEYLAKTQHKSGYFPKDGGGKWGVLDGDERVYFTSIAMLAFLSEGSTPDEGKYNESIKSGIKFLLNSCKDSGGIYSSDRAHKTAETAVATLALVECYRKTKDEELKRRISARVKSAIRCFKMGRTMGGLWGYDPGDVLSNMGMSYAVMTALISAKSAGFEVDDKMFQRAINGLKRVILKDGSVCYEPSEAINPACNEVREKVDSMILNMKAKPGWRLLRASALLYIFYKTGNKDTAEAQRMKVFVEKDVKKHLKFGIIQIDPHISYTFLFSSLGLKVAFEKEKWNQWYEILKKEILKNQKKGGYWEHLAGDDPPKSPSEAKLARCLGTAMALIILQLPQTHLKFMEE